MITIRVGDCVETLRTLPDASVQCCVTSPPYFGLRDYGHDGQIGLEATPEAYVAKMVEVFREVRRVLRDDGVLFLNLGDSYFGGGRGGNPDGSPHQKQRTNRGPVGMPSGARRVAACDTSGKAPEDSIIRGCFCESLCGACRKAYQIGKSHSDTQRVPTPSSSPCETSREHMELPPGHLPTLGSLSREARTADATPDSLHLPSRAFERPPASLASKTDESSLRHPAGFHQSDKPLACLLCGTPLERNALAFADTSVCTCDNEMRSDACCRHISDRFSSDLAYPHYTTTLLKPKDLIGIPWRVAFALQADGWWLRQDIIWHKPNPMPESVTDRCTKAHEYIFLLSKSATYYYDHEAVKESASEASGWAKQRAKGVNTWKYNDTPERVTATGGNNNGTMGTRGRRNRRSVWTVTTKPFKGAHFATFPPALIEPCILAGSRVAGKRCDCDAVVYTPTGEVESADPTATTGRAGMNRPRGTNEGTRPITRREQRHHAKELRESQHRAAMEAEAGSAFDHYIRTDASGARPVSAALREAWYARGWITNTSPCDCPTFSADTVLDPFGGAGTTGLVAQRNGRNAILCEINPAYAEMARERLTKDAGLSADVHIVTTTEATQ